MNEVFMQYIDKIFSGQNVMTNELMSRHTTFRVGGEASVFVQVETTEQLKKIIPYLKKVGIDYFILGNGSNLLVSDKGYKGVILQIGSKMSDIHIEGNCIRAKAGALLSKVSKEAGNAGLTGLEFASGIPGTIGGAVVMNAGAYDGEMKLVVKEVTVLNQEGEELVLDKDTMEFGYRSSILKKYPFVVTEVLLELSQGNQEEIRAKTEDFAERRRQKQPLEYPSAGSTFKRPEGNYAGKLIMEAGLRGYRIGGAQVSEKHCGFLVNTGNALGADVYELIQEVQEKVYSQFGVRLEPEVILLGDF